LLELEERLLSHSLHHDIAENSTVGQRLTERIEAAERRRAVESLRVAKERVDRAMEMCIAGVEAGTPLTGKRNGGTKEIGSGKDNARSDAEDELRKAIAEFERLRKALAVGEQV